MAGEGDPRALDIAREIATRLEAKFLAIETASKTLYHAAAVVASNYLVTLFHVATRMLGGCGIGSDDALQVLMPLVRGTLANVERRGVAKALTGPIARGDVATVDAHCRKIARSLPGLLTFYQAMGQQTLPLAKAGGGLDADSIDALKSLLKMT
jgi:predicted short-subunit dehydrogenase-like oxidoreductase (DUF2520 family)